MPGPTTLSNAERDRYSIVHELQTKLDAYGWEIPVASARGGFPINQEIKPPAIFVLYGPNSVSGYELGSWGKTRQIFVHIYARNDSQRDRLAEEITDIIRDGLSIYNFVTGNETSPEVSGRFDTQPFVDWQPIRPVPGAPDVEKYRAVVNATLLRQDV